jgi:hypothetical protein
MSITTRFLAGLSLFFSLLFAGCVKSGVSTLDNCNTIRKAKITGAQPSYYTGDEISLKCSVKPEAFFSWRKKDGPSDASNSPTLNISSCTKYDEGWYYLVVSNPDCTTRIDSVYIAVLNKPATAPCTPSNNTVSFSSIPGITFSKASFGIDPSWNCKTLTGYQALGYPDINVYFNYYWNSREPEDGEYSIASTPTFSDNNLYTVLITSLYSSIYFQARPGKVYVSHVNGKLQVTFCSLTLSGSLGGPTYTTTATGRITAP